MQVTIQLNRCHYDVTLVGTSVRYFGNPLGAVDKDSGKWVATDNSGASFTTSTRKDCLRWPVNGHLFPGAPLKDRF